MIKKLLGLFIGLFTLFGFSYGFQYFDVSLDKIPSYGNSNYEIGVLKKGDFITNFLGTSKGVFAYSDRFFLWWFGGGLYRYDYRSSLDSYSETKNLQGFVQYYRSCDSLISGNALSNCSALQLYDYYDPVITNYLSALTYGDLVYFDNGRDYLSCGYQCHYYKYYGNLCFSHSGFNTSLCFYVSEMNRYLTSHPSEAPLKDSLGFSDNLTIGSIPYDYIGRSPAYVQIDTGSVATGSSNVICPTVGQLLSYYDKSLFNTGICYGASIIYTGGSFQTITPSSIFELFTDLNEYKQYLQLYGTYCNSVSTMCEQAFSGKELQYLYIANLNSELRLKEKQVFQYCNLSLNFDPNTSSCVGSGVYQGGDQVSREDVLQGITNNSYVNITPVTELNDGDNTVFNIFSFSSEYTGDALDQIGKMFTKFTSLFKQQTGNINGILPSYIIVVLLGIILFKLFKK